MLFKSPYLTTEKSTLARAEYGLVLGVDMESKGTKMVYLLQKKQIVYRNHFWRVILDENVTVLMNQLKESNPILKVTEENILGRRYLKRATRNRVSYKLLNDPGNIKESPTEIIDMTITEGRAINEGLTDEAVDTKLLQMKNRNVFEPVMPEE